jgi:Immunoglobulin domain.
VIEAQSGENVTLDCAAGGSPIPELTWTFLPRIPGSKGRPLANTSRNGLNVVTLHHVTPDHAGTYTCTASVAPDKRTDTVMQVSSMCLGLCVCGGRRENVSHCHHLLL